VTVHFGPLAPLMRAGTKLRVSVAVVGGGAEPSVEHREEELKEEAAGWIYSLPVRWSAAAGGRLAVTVEAIALGVWGSAVIDLPRGE